MTVLVRPATTTDVAAVGDITVKAYSAGPGAGTADYIAVLRDAQSRLDDALLFVAVDQVTGTVVGSVTLAQAHTPHSELARPGELEVRYLSVDPNYWGQGVGSALMAQARSVAAEQQLVLVLDAITHNTKVHDMYTKMGFVRIPKRDFSPVEGVDLLAYIDAASPSYRPGAHE